MSYRKLTEDQINKCKDVYDQILDEAELEEDRDYITYEELEKALVLLTGQKFKHKNVFFMLLSEIDIGEANKVTFVDLLSIYHKYKFQSLSTLGCY